MHDGGRAEARDVEELATRLFQMAGAGQADRLCAYVDAGVPVDLHDDKGGTLLVLAACHGHAATVRALLARGADPERLGDRGRRPARRGRVLGRVPRRVRQCS
ncbi:hypothetical protein ABZU32_09145 [Sphaerisporangium sp. NPDC005288]|uniref:hypothetical protein n=1 Tax=Sphaerisporangium sp. NPDC005288 TaxID=3155114 RepID=UPI0033BD963E